MFPKKLSRFLSIININPFLQRCLSSEFNYFLLLTETDAAFGFDQSPEQILMK